MTVLRLSACAIARQRRVVAACVGALIVSAVLAPVALSGSGSSGSGSGSSGSGGKVKLTTSNLPNMAPGQSGWVSLNWEGDKWDATNFRVTASEGSGRVKISYPENTGSYSSLYRESTLFAGGTDYNSVRLEVGPGVRDDLSITFHVEYDMRVGNGSGKGEDKHYASDVTMKLGIVEAGGNAAAIATSSLTVSRSTPEWRSIDVTATDPGVVGVRLTAEPPSGVKVSYPANGSSSGLEADADLADGETDHASLLLDASGTKTGTYKIKIRIDYANGQDVEREIPLVVTA